MPGVDIGAAIAACGQLLLTHGGHPGAAGVSLLPENIPAFRRALSTQVELHRDVDIRVGLQIDAETTLDQLSLELVSQVNRLAPFGQGNPQPQFVTYGLEVVDDRRLGREGQHRRLTVRAARTLVEAPKQTVVWWHGADATLPTGPIDLVYTLNVNEYKGERTLQLQYVDCRSTAQPEIVLAAPVRSLPHTVHDLRKQPLTLAELPPPGQAHWYAEGALLESSSPGVSYAPHSALASPAALHSAPLPLVLWTAPPSAEMLHWLVASSGATEIYLCGQRTTDDAPQSVLQQVAGMCKYALAQDGVADVGRMASRLGLTEAIARLALLVLASGGMVRLGEWLEGDRVRISGGPADDHRQGGSWPLRRFGSPTGRSARLPAFFPAGEGGGTGDYDEPRVTCHSSPDHPSTRSLVTRHLSPRIPHPHSSPPSPVFGASIITRSGSTKR